MSAGATVRLPGVQAALAAALLFGVAAPLAKLLLGATDPVMLAGLLYLGSGVGLALWRRISDAAPVRLPRSEMPWFAGAVLAVGVVGPVLLLLGLSWLGAAETSLLLTAEGVFTAVIAWAVFRENVDRRVAFGMLAITLGTLVIAGKGSGVALGALGPSLLVLAACSAWGVDNNLTRQVSLTDATWIASTKGLVAGMVNVALALAFGAQLPDIATVAGALLLGFIAYGVSLSLFVHALRDLGTARTGAYFGVAPFFGAILAVLLGEPLTAALLIAGALMAIGVWLHLTERHGHMHQHAEMEHAHWHTHDAHHQHDHPDSVAPGVRHFHPHRHAAMTHSHAHFPDAHHRHAH